jgi:hypothetical protein
MFKAKLITDPEYYALRRRQLILFFLIFTPTALMSNVFDLPVWLAALALVAYVILAWASWRNQRKMKGLTGHKRIEIDQEAIRILNANGECLEVIDLNTVDAIEVKETYPMPQETLQDMADEVSGSPQRHYVRIIQNGESRQFDFEVNTYYMLKQLEKLVAAWTKAGYELMMVPAS